VSSYIVTAISVAGWGFIGRYAVVWSVVIFSSQLINGLKEQLLVGKRVWALELYLRASSDMLNDCSKVWRQILLGKLTEDEIAKKVNSHAQKYAELEDSYIRPYSYGDSEKIAGRANKRANQELNTRHGGGEQCGKTTVSTI